MANAEEDPTLVANGQRTQRQEPPASLLLRALRRAAACRSCRRAARPPTCNITVLPIVSGAEGGNVELKPRNEQRYQHVRRLGAGAMGEVDLVLDNDIGRTVAKSSSSMANRAR